MMGSSVDQKWERGSGILKDFKNNKVSTKDKTEPMGSTLFHEWCNKLKDPKNMKMNQLTTTTFDLLVDYYNTCTKKPDDGSRDCDAGMRDFLEARSPGDDERMDRCVRWSVLRKALNTKQNKVESEA